MSPYDALKIAKERELDLVEVSPNANPPVCKILDFGKYQYDQKKKAKEAKKTQNVINVKEVKFKQNIAEHDYQTKLRNATKFLEAKDKVKVSLRFRGREVVHKNLTFELFNRFKDDLAELAKPEIGPKMEGRQVIMILSPVTGK